MSKKEIIEVTISTDEINCLATIQRSLLTSINAARKLKDSKLVTRFLGELDEINDRYRSACIIENR